MKITPDTNPILYNSEPAPQVFSIALLKCGIESELNKFKNERKAAKMISIGAVNPPINEEYVLKSTHVIKYDTNITKPINLTKLVFIIFQLLLYMRIRFQMTPDGSLSKTSVSYR